jgi:hypothetical protein
VNIRQGQLQLSVHVQADNDACTEKMHV